LFGSFFISKICCQYFERQKKGLIINFSSIYGDSGPDQSIYGKLKKNYLKKTIENKMITTEQICRYVEFNISNPEIVSGSCINLDGGSKSIF
jgi:short-subunit dehydrogenase